MLLGTGSAQAIPIIASIFLTRIYTPEEYGVFAIFMAIITIIGSVVTLKYELAILVPKSEQDAIEITILSIVSTFFFSFITLFLLLLFKDPLLQILNITILGNWIYLIPFVILFMGIYTSLSYFATRIGMFKIIAKTRIYQSFSGAITQILFGIIHLGVGGLILGTIISNLTGNIRLFKRIYSLHRNELINTRINKLKSLASKYSDYPKYSIPSTIFNSISLQAMNFIIPMFYSATLLGYYSLSQRIVVTPMTVIGNAISQVFLNEAAKEIRETKKAKQAFKSTLKKLIIIGIPLYGILYWVVEDLIAWVFGAKWRVAGEITKILIILLFFRFIVSPLSSVLNLYEKQKIALAWQISLLVLTVITLILAMILELDFYQFLKVYVFSQSINYFIMFIICYFISKKVKP